MWRVYRGPPCRTRRGPAGPPDESFATPRRALRWLRGPCPSPNLTSVPSSPLLDFTGAVGDGARIEAALQAAVHTSDPYLDELASHLIIAGGKRLRPVLAVVAAQVAGGRSSDAAVQGGIACELVQTGSLYHDDVIDESYSRRGVETVNAKWGNLQAILAGDFLLSRASE